MLSLAPLQAQTLTDTAAQHTARGDYPRELGYRYEL